MTIANVHEKRLAELNEEISALDRQIGDDVRRRRGNPASDAAERVEQVKQQRDRLAAIRAGIEGDILAIRQHESSAARVAHRARGRDALTAVLGTAQERVQIADTMDRAAKVFLAAMDEMNKLGATAQAAVQQAATAAIPFSSDLMDATNHERLMDQRRLMLETTSPHAGSFSGADMQYALVLLIDEILRRVENPRGIAQIAPGWQFTPGETVMPFAQAAQQAHERMERGAGRIELALEEPK